MAGIRSFTSLLSGSSLPDLSSWGARSGSQYAPVISNIKSKGSASMKAYKVDEEKIYSVIGTSLKKYLDRIDELKTYLESHITKTSIDVIKDSVIELMVLDSDSIISLPEDPQAEKAINRILNNMQIPKHILGDISDLIYYGSYSYAIEFNKETEKLNLRYLKDPSKVISTWKDSKLDSYFTYDLSGELVKFDKDQIFSISTYDYKLELENNLTQDKFIDLIDEIDGTSDRTKLNIQRERLSDKSGIEYKSLNKRYLAGSPLFNSITGKIKEYILKDYLLSILSIKDLIQPIILLVGLEKTTSLEEGIDLTQKIENLINQNVDISFMEAKGLSVRELAMSLIDNIRVLPDYDGKLTGMSDLNLDKLSDKIDRIRADQQTIREDIINSIGLPIDLFEGRSSRWESIKMSQRFESKISYYVDMINNSVVLLAENIYKRLKKSKGLNIEGKIISKLMDTESLEYSKKVARIDSLSEQMNRIADLSDIVSRVDPNQQGGLIEVKELKKYIQTALSKLNDPTLAKLINPNKKPEDPFAQQGMEQEDPGGDQEMPQDQSQEGYQ
jgi:hypothetical protein